MLEVAVFPVSGFGIFVFIRKIQDGGRFTKNKFAQIIGKWYSGYRIIDEVDDSEKNSLFRLLEGMPEGMPEGML